MSSRIRRPETTTLQISRGDWLLVKRHLNAGERRAIYGLMMKTGAESDRIDATKVGLSKMVVYLLDWSITDADEKPVAIRDQSDEAKEAALNALDPEDFTEIMDAIDAHDDAMTAQRVAEKNGQAGGNVSSPISPSLDSSTGGTSGSENSRLMSMTS